MTKSKFEYTGSEVLETLTEAKNYNEYLSRFVKDNIDNKNIKILDFGSGTGTYVDILKKDKIKVDCLEPDSKLQKLLRGKGYKVISNIDDVKPKTYDLIYSFNVLEHIEDDFEVFEKLSLILKDSGILIIYVPAFQSLYSSLDKLVEHYRRYRKSRLEKMAKQNNLKIKELYYCDPIGYLGAYGFKLVGNKKGELSVGSVKIYDKFVFPVSKFIQPIFKKFIGKNTVLIAKKP